MSSSLRPDDGLQPLRPVEDRPREIERPHPTPSAGASGGKGRGGKGLLIAVAVVGLVLFGISRGGSDSEKERAEAARNAALLARLRATHPDRRFALFTGDKESVAMDAQLERLRVDRVDLDRGAGGDVEANVYFTSTSEEAIAPKIYVSLFDAQGRQIGRSAVVNHTRADVEPETMTNTSDLVDVADGAEAVIVAVDDDRKARERAQATARRKAEAAETTRTDAERQDEQDRQAEIAELGDDALDAPPKSRGPKPVPIKPNGMVPGVKEYLERHLNDERSLRVVECSEVFEYRKNDWAQTVRYRATNGSGAMTLQEKCFVLHDGNVIDVENALLPTGDQDEIAPVGNSGGVGRSA